ncbi:hypothetical protein EYF80_066452 [Liparis tanakae]|jgi:hypothetical protein
MSGS